MTPNNNYPTGTTAISENEVTLGLVVTDPNVNPNHHYSAFSMEFEGEIKRLKADCTAVNGQKVTSDKVRVAVKHNNSIDYSDSAYEYIATHLQEGDYIRIRGRLDTAYDWPVVVIERRSANILWHEHQYVG